MTAAELRKKKLLTSKELMKIIQEIHPIIIDKVDYYYTITDFTGFQTSHMDVRETIIANNKELIDALPPDHYIDDVVWVDFKTHDGGVFLDKDGNTFTVKSNY